jgi:hypothetical protein
MYGAGGCLSGFLRMFAHLRNQWLVSQRVLTRSQKLPAKRAQQEVNTSTVVGSNMRLGTSLTETSITRCAGVCSADGDLADGSVRKYTLTTTRSVLSERLKGLEIELLLPLNTGLH